MTITGIRLRSPRLLVAGAMLLPLLVPGQAERASAGTLTVTPAEADNMTTVTLSMSGAHLLHQTISSARNNMVVEVTGPAGHPTTKYTATNVRFDGSVLKADVALATGTLGAAPGDYTVRLCEVRCGETLPVVPPEQVTAVTEDVGTFTVVAKPVSVTSASPSLVAAEAATTTVTLFGSFARGATVVAGSADVQAGTASVVDGERLTVPVTTSATTPPGRYSLTVRNTDGSEAVCVECIRVADFPLTSLSPANATNGAGSHTISASGTGIPVGTPLVGTLTPSPAIKGQGPIRSAATEALSATAWTGAFDLADVAPGNYELTLSAANDRTLGICRCLFKVDPVAPPTLSAVVPGAVGQAAQGFQLTAQGANFPRGAVLTAPAASKVVLGETKWVDNKTLTTTATVDPAATPGKIDVTVTNPSAAGSSVCAGCLVVNPRPMVESMSPDTVVQGAQRVPITLRGQNFNAETVLTLSPGLTLHAAKLVDDKRMDLTVSVAPAVSGGLKSVTARNTDGGVSDSVTALLVQRVVVATLTSTAATVTRGGAVRLSGRVHYRDTRAPVVDQVMSLTVATTGAAQPLADVTTDRTGAWSYRHVPTRNSAYRLEVTAVGGAPVTTKAIRVGVAPRLSITSPRAGSTTTTASPLTVTGTITRGTVTSVTVSARSSRGTTYTRTVTADSQGRFTARLALPAGSYTLWAVSKATAAYVQGRTTSRSVTRR